MKYLAITNLEKYQHYSDRQTIWIKWYFKCLDDYRFCQLTDAERWLFIGLVMLACREANRVPYDPLYVWHRVAYRTPKGSYRVAIGLKKMLKLGIIELKNDSTDKSREDKIRKDKKEFSYKEKLTNYENGEKWGEYPYYKEEKMRWYYKKWQVFNEGQWKDFAGDYKEITWR